MEQEDVVMGFKFPSQILSQSIFGHKQLQEMRLNTDIDREVKT